jgi:OOP family OmpA-OmpF porin
VNDLEELKSLLFGEEKQTLDSLTERVQRPETRAADVADVLPEAIRLSRGSGEELVAELRDPVGRCITASLHEEPQEFANALYPVIGPAIRKSIAETLKAFAQQINQTMEHSLSLKGLKWRLQASRAGIPFGDFVLQQSLLYRVEQAYLISRENGLLVSHVHHDASRIKDSDAVSAMFTAIQDFVKESFSPDRTGRLEVADMGEFSLWAVHGPNALLVCVIRGVPPKALRSDLTAVLERIHFRHGEALRSYNGDTSSMQGVEEQLDECLRFQAEQQVESGKRAISVPLLIIVVSIVGLLGYFAFDRWQQQQRSERLESVVNATPGIFLNDIEYRDDTYVLRGLRDPLAASAEEISRMAGLEPREVVAELKPYRSLEPEIVYQRAASVLMPPEGVSLAASGGRIVVSGRASQDWIDTLQTKIDANVAGMPVVIGSLDSIEWLQLEATVAESSGEQFFFSFGVALVADELLRLQRYATHVRSLADAASRLNGRISFRINGFTDGEGSVELNRALSTARAGAAKAELMRAGIGAAAITTGAAVATAPSAGSDPSLRRVTIDVELLHE